MTAFVYRHSGILLVVWILFIFLLCAMPGQYFPSAGWMELLSFDKWVHAALFFVLNFLFFLFAHKRHQNRVYLYLYTLLGIIYGVGLEMMQASLFSNRSFDYMDMVANALGALIALFMHRFLHKLFSRWLA